MPDDTPTPPPERAHALPAVIIHGPGCCPGCQNCFGMGIGCHQDPCACHLPCTCKWDEEDESLRWRDGCEWHDAVAGRLINDSPGEAIVAMERPEVLALQRHAEDLRAEAEETFEMVIFVASLRSDCCSDGCEHPLCYRAWRAYPNG